ncbi:hypothetical protein AB0A63_33080 [Lentzea sp. NPDC042327]|uniref:hypothetical protein n=1 Tax=Lentzea sp. NPDC042327 TaxID=3154801 RepID=UPI0033F524D7
MVTPGEYLDLLDARLPGLVAGAHLHGSRVLDDVVFDSDLDVVVELAAAADVPAVDGVDVSVVMAGDLSRPVSSVTPLFGEVTPVLWQQLRTVGQTVRGTRPACPVTAAEVAAYCRANLVSYWKPQLDAGRAALRTVDQRIPVFREAVLWVGLGPARLWHTIRTGEIVSKSRAGVLAAEQWPDLGPLLLDLVEARRDAAVVLTPDHLAAALGLGDRVLADVTA